MKKTRHLNALQWLFLAIFGSLAIFAPAEAATILTDDFDALTAGVLGGQGQWVDTGAGSNALVSTDADYSAPNGCRMINEQDKIQTTTLTARATGVQKFKVKPVMSCGSIGCNEEIWFKAGISDWIFRIKFLGGPGGWYVNNTGASSGNLFLTNGTWYDFVVEWNGTQSRISIDNGATFPDGWVNYTMAGNPDNIYSYGNGYKDIYFDDFGGLIPPHELAITYPEDEANLDNQLNHFSVEYFTPDCGDFHLQIAIGTDEQAVENATSSSSGIEYVDTLFALPEWCNATGGFDVGNYIILEENTNYYAKPMLYRYEGWEQRYNTKLAEGAVIGFAIGEYFGLATASAAATFYNNNLPAFFGEAEPSAIYNTLTKVFNAAFNPLLNFLSQITIYFSTATAIENGTNAGYPIAVFLAYAALINNFAGIPLVEIITTMLILQLAIVVINLTLKGKKTVA